MDFAQMRDQVEHVAAQIRHHDDLTEEQKDAAFSQISADAVLVAGQCLVSIADSLAEIRRLLDERARHIPTVLGAE